MDLADEGTRIIGVDRGLRDRQVNHDTNLRENSLADKFLGQILIFGTLLP